MARRQWMTTVLVPVLRNPSFDHPAALRAVLTELSQDVRRERKMRFELIATAHFARFAVVPAATAGDRPVPARLLFSTVHDGRFEDHLDKWLAAAGGALDAIFSQCEGYPGLGLVRPHAVRAWLLGHRIGSSAFYRGHPDRTMPQVRGELGLRAVLDRALDEHDGGRRAGLRPALRAAIEHQGRFLWALARPARPRLAPPCGRDLVALAVIAGVIAIAIWSLWLGIAVLAALVLAGGLLYAAALGAEAAEQTPVPARPRVDRAHHEELTAIEDNIAQNQLTHLVDVKPGLLRRVVLGGVLWVVDLRARYKFRHGHLAGIPTIHFAQWSLIDDGRRLLFLSNYDGSWESYLGDFIDFASKGLNAIWTNAVGFPPTRRLIYGGAAAHPQAFKAWTRAQQVPTQLWYSWYRDLSVANVNRNSLIRRGLAAPATQAPEPAWTRELFG